jgi:hypothetical protein
MYDLDSRRLGLVHCVLFASSEKLAHRGSCSPVVVAMSNVSDSFWASLHNGFHVVKSESTPQPESSLVNDKTHTKTSSMTAYANEDGSKGVDRAFGALRYSRSEVRMR